MSTEGGYPPGDGGLPIVGNTVELSRDILEFYEGLRNEYGRIASYRVFGTDACMVADPEAIRQILLEDHDAYEKGDVLTRSLGDAMGDGLFLSAGEQWHRQRTRMQPAFYRERLDTYVPAMRDTASQSLDDWHDEAVIEVNDAMTAMTIDVLGRTLFGVDVADEPVVTDASDAILARFDTNRFWSFLPDSVPTPTNRRYRREIERLREFVDGLADQRRRRPREERGDDLLSILVGFVESGDLTMSEFRDNLITFLFAGHETTALGLTYTVLCLARNPDEQERIRAEVDSVCDGSVTAADLPELEQTGRAIDEALRLYPPVYLFFRETARDVKLAGYRIPNGTTLVLSPWVVHRDSAWWDDPQTYRPDRFAGESDRPEYAYFPFGGGPRHCIGMRFARMEMKTVIASILRRYEFELVSDPDPELIASSNLKPAEDIEIRVSERASTTSN
ncbi:cytochrome P450 [Halogeometricum borinquense]|uniref:Cytochrome P450 n=1 Tax=Halogeometricum borinquense TaxID=60847 RepID=A0A482T1V7_9EURY|nr:cytochrome P450 [Halogeometricum borinquense]RYJ08670.1 cytochrome P450 [Halogeometricum borinquense]